MASLRVRLPDHNPTAAQAVGHVLQLAAALLERDAAYVVDGSVYARTSGAAARAELDPDTALRLSAEYHDHPDDPNKEHPLDVAVWSAAGEGDVSWPSPWGEGRPGWHAECAAMVLALFGPVVDVHCGGADLAFPHHACEAVLAETATGVSPFARAWVRAGTVSIGGEKMAKSTGNLVLVDDLLRDYPPAAVRLLCLNRHWSDGWSFMRDELDATAGTLEQLYAAAAKPGHAGAGLVPAALLDDLNVPGALELALEEGGQAARTFVELLALA
jgi:cysteinyl-tRNA synthetase